MLKNTLLTSAVSASVLLSACGGGSGSGPVDITPVTDQVEGVQQIVDGIFLEAQNPVVPSRYIVVFREGAEATLDDLGLLTPVQQLAANLLGDVGGEALAILENTINGVVLAGIDEAAARAIANNPLVAYVEEDGIFQTNVTQTSATWGLDRIDDNDLPLDSTYEYDSDGSGTHIYVIDTGILSSHAEFAGRMGQGFNVVDAGGTGLLGGGLLGGGGLFGGLFGGGGGGGIDENDTEDCNGHGTHVAGTAAGTEYGVAKGATLHAVRVLGCTGSGSNSGVIAGVDWVAGNAIAPAIANMSLGGGASTALDDAIRNAVAQGVTFVVAAGNDDTNACNGSPNRVAEAITVGSTTNSDARSSFSNFGTCVDIFAPGSSITSAWHTGNNDTNTISGTSMASPHVAGAAALYLGQNPTASPDEVFTAVLNGGVALTLTGIGSGSPNLMLNTQLLD